MTVRSRPASASLLVRDLPKCWTDKDLLDAFAEYMPLSARVFLRGPRQISMCLGYVEFASVKQAAIVMKVNKTHRRVDWYIQVANEVQHLSTIAKMAAHNAIIGRGT